MPYNATERTDNPTRVAVVDAHPICRAGVVELLRSVPEFEIVAEGASGIDAIAIARETRPNIMVFDAEMPRQGARATIEKVLEANAGTKIIILTRHDDHEQLRDLFEAGATAYLLKSAARSELIAAVDAASRNQGTVLVSVSRATFIRLSRPAYPQSDLLCARELDVIALLVEGHSNQDIATKLYISRGTVKRHLTNIYAKLGASSRLEAVQKAARLGISPHPAQDRSPR